MMRWILAGLCSLGLAFGWNRFLPGFGWAKRWRIGLFIPLGEEAIKYFVAFLFHLHPLGLGLIFGLGEGLYESGQIRRRSKALTIVSGVLTHLLFGWIYALNGVNGLSLAIATLLHAWWNTAIWMQK